MVSTRKAQGSSREDEEYLESIGAENGSDGQERGGSTVLTQGGAPVVPAFTPEKSAVDRESGDEQWAAGGAAVQVAPPPAVEEEENAEEEPEWEPELEGAEVLDDPVRMYLREIGRVNLLTSKDERVLARKMEGGKRLNLLEAEVRGDTGRPVPAWEVCLTILHRLVGTQPMLSALANRLGLPSILTLSQITDHPKLRAAIDVLLDAELMDGLALDLNLPRDESVKNVIGLSLDSWVLPTEIVDVLEDCTMAQLGKMLENGECRAKLPPMEYIYVAYFGRIRAEAMRSPAALD